MAVNPNIALAVKGPEFADPMALYGKLAAIQGAQSQNQLAQYQLATAQRTEARDVARMNALASAGSNEDAIANALLRTGDIKGYNDFLKASADRKISNANLRKTQGELLDSALKRARSFLDTIDPLDPDAPNQYMAWHDANHKDEIIGPVLAARGVTAEQSRARIKQAIQQGPQAFANLLNQSKLGTEEFIKQNAPKVTPQDLGGSSRLIQYPGLGGPATVVLGSVATKTPTITEQQRADEVTYIDAGDRFIPVRKLTGQAVENVQPTAKGLTPAQQQEIEYKDVGDKFVPVYKYNGQAVPGMPSIPKNLTPGDQQRAQEIEYKDVGDKFVPVYKISGQAVEGMPSIAKNLTPGDQQRAQEVDYKDAGDKFVPVYKMSGQPVEGAKAIPKGISAYQEAQLRNENQRIVQEKSRIDLERRRVVVAEEQDRRAKDPDFQRKMAEARKTGEDIAKNTVAAQQALPKIVTRAEEGLRLIDEMIGERDDTGKLLPGQKVHPGFTDAVGVGLPLRFVPGTSASDFQARFDQIKGASFLEAFESLKGGGAITEKEGEKATGAINRMGLAQSEREFIAAARDLQEVVRKGIANAQRKAAAGAAGTGASPSPAASSGTPPPPPGFKRD
jgi:hypothetical protein